MFRKALRIQPTDITAHIYLGNLLEVTGDTTRACKEYQAALRINPDLQDIKSRLEYLSNAKAD